MNKEEIKEPVFKNYKDKQRYYEKLNKPKMFFESVVVDWKETKRGKAKEEQHFTYRKDEDK
jgi:hypothetical protein